MANEPEVTAETGKPDTPNTTQDTPVEPTTHQHSPRLLNVCRELGIDPAQAATMDDATLRREIQDAQLEFQVRTAKNPPRPNQPKPPPEPEETFELPPELKAKLSDVDPALVEAITHVGKQTVARSRKTQLELANLRQQQAMRELQAQVVRELDKLPPVRGTKDARDRSVWSELDTLAANGVIDQTTPVAQAVKLAYENVYGAEESEPVQKPTTTQAVQPKRATPTAKPTSRLEPHFQGKLDNMNGNGADDFIP